MTFSNTTQKTTRWSDLQHSYAKLKSYPYGSSRLRYSLLLLSEKRIPWSFNGIENGYNGRNVNNSPQWNFDLRHQNSQWQNDTVEGECDNMGHDLSYQEETIKHI